jgi:hypothetical protein
MVAEVSLQLFIACNLDSLSAAKQTVQEALEALFLLVFCSRFWTRMNAQ